MTREWKKQYRRGAILNVIAPRTGFACPVGGEVDAMGGIMARLFWSSQGWTVATVAWEEIGPYFQPGQQVPFRNVPLDEFLKDLEFEFGLKPVPSP